uniref:Protein FAM33A n=1 Tax=Leersia perrieri TaxID=77586 RepID=A0A0D9V641_9ORYZ
MAPDLSGRRPRQHSAVSDVLSTLAAANSTLADVQRRLEAEFRAAYPDHANPAKLVARLKRIQEEVAALKGLCRDLLVQKQELIDTMRTSLMVQRGATQRLLASSGLPLMSDEDEAAYANLNQIVDEWTAQVEPETSRNEKAEDTNQIFFSAVV